MGFLDSIVDRSFRDEEAGRVVVFPGACRNRGYLVKSEAEELKIRSFLEMYLFAHLSILSLGMLGANAWSTVFTNALLDKPAAHLPSAMGISLGLYSLLVGLPYFLLWRSYKKARRSFVSPEDGVVVSGTISRRQSWIVIAALVALGALLLGGVLVALIRAK
jgi:hypothetical protein